jgi:hypothetical protein
MLCPLHGGNTDTGKHARVDAVAQTRRVYEICNREVVAFPERDEIAPPVRPLYDYWRQECGGGLPVPKQKIDALALPLGLLPNILLVDVLSDPPDFRYRLIGTEITRFVGRDSTGRLLSEIPYPENVGERITKIYSAVAHAGEVLYVEDPADWASKDFVQMATLLLPATSDGRQIDLIFGAVMAVSREIPEPA